jgi:hypothetical protein
MPDDDLRWLEGMLGAASKDERADMRGARCPACGASDFISVSDLYAESLGRIEESGGPGAIPRDGNFSPDEIVRKFAPPRQRSALAVAIGVAIPLAAIAFYAYRRFGDTIGSTSAIIAAVATVTVLMTFARKFSDEYYYARRKWNRLHVCRKCGQVVAG